MLITGKSLQKLNYYSTRNQSVYSKVHSHTDTLLDISRFVRKERMTPIYPVEASLSGWKNAVWSDPTFWSFFTRTQRTDTSFDPNQTQLLSSLTRIYSEPNYGFCHVFGHVTAATNFYFQFHTNRSRYRPKDDISYSKKRKTITMAVQETVLPTVTEFWVRTRQIAKRTVVLSPRQNEDPDLTEHFKLAPFSSSLRRSTPEKNSCFTPIFCPHLERSLFTCMIPDLACSWLFLTSK